MRGRQIGTRKPLTFLKKTKPAYNVKISILHGMRSWPVLKTSKIHEYIGSVDGTTATCRRSPSTYPRSENYILGDIITYAT